MANCFKCGISDEKAQLSVAIGDEGLVKLCDNCLAKEGLPVIKRPTTYQLKAAEGSSGVYERLSKIAGVDPKTHRERFGMEGARRRELSEKQDVNLRALVDRTYKKAPVIEIKPRGDLVANFHWFIMRARRMKKLTRTQLAQEIGEPESVIEMAERGAMPDDGYRLVRKLETVLGIRLVKDELRDSTLPKELDLAKRESKELTIGDLKMIKAYKETENIKDEIEEDVSLNEEFNVKIEDLKKEKKGFWGKMFGKKKDEVEEKEEVGEEEEKI